MNKQLKEDVDNLKGMGFIAIARQYSKMARSLMVIKKYAMSHEFDKNLEHNLRMTDIKDFTGKALKRFEK